MDAKIIQYLTNNHKKFYVGYTDFKDHKKVWIIRKIYFVFIVEWYSMNNKWVHTKKIGILKSLIRNFNKKKNSYIYFVVKIRQKVKI